MPTPHAVIYLALVLIHVSVGAQTNNCGKGLPAEDKRAIKSGLDHYRNFADRDLVTQVKSCAVSTEDAERCCADQPTAKNCGFQNPVPQDTAAVNGLNSAAVRQVKEATNNFNLLSVFEGSCRQRLRNAFADCDLQKLSGQKFESAEEKGRAEQIVGDLHRTVAGPLSKSHQCLEQQANASLQTAKGSLDGANASGSVDYAIYCYSSNLRDGVTYNQCRVTDRNLAKGEIQKNDPTGMPVTPVHLDGCSGYRSGDSTVTAGHCLKENQQVAATTSAGTDGKIHSTSTELQGRRFDDGMALKNGATDQDIAVLKDNAASATPTASSDGAVRLVANDQIEGCEKQGNLLHCNPTVLRQIGSVGVTRVTQYGYPTGAYPLGGGGYDPQQTVYVSRGEAFYDAQNNQVITTSPSGPGSSGSAVVIHDFKAGDKIYPNVIVGNHARGQIGPDRTWNTVGFTPVTDYNIYVQVPSIANQQLNRGRSAMSGIR